MSGPETVMPSSGRRSVRRAPVATVADTAFVRTVPTATRAPITPAATHDGTTTVMDVSATTPRTRPRVVPKSAVLPSADLWNARPRNPTVSPDANVAGTTPSRLGGGVATARKRTMTVGASGSDASTVEE